MSMATGIPMAWTQNTSFRHHSIHEIKMSNLESFKCYLGQTVRVQVSDGRVVEGRLQCMDRELNFIIAEAVEYFGVEDGE